MPVLIALCLLVPAALAHAQAAYAIPSVPAPRDPLPRFTIAPRGGALAPIGLPLPPIGLQPSDAPPERGRPQSDPVLVYPWPAMVFYAPPPAAAAPLAPAPKAVERAPAPGRLILEVDPADAQVFADGYYIGLARDFNAARGGAPLDPGVHRLDITANGYEPVVVDLKIAAGQAVTYRAPLEALPPAHAAPPSTFYLIPGCYMGNVPPAEARLPATCDQSRAIVWQP